MTERNDRDYRRRHALALVGGNPWHLTHADTCALQGDGLWTDCDCGLQQLRDDWDAKQLPST
jgi:hypothetical protein